MDGEWTVRPVWSEVGTRRPGVEHPWWKWVAGVSLDFPRRPVHDRCHELSLAYPGVKDPVFRVRHPRQERELLETPKVERATRPVDTSVQDSRPEWTSQTPYSPVVTLRRIGTGKGGGSQFGGGDESGRDRKPRSDGRSSDQASWEGRAALLGRPGHTPRVGGRRPTTTAS